LCREGIALYGAQLPGREVRVHEPFDTDLRDAAGHIASEIAAIEGRVGLFGHSMGAFLAFEAAVRLAAVAKEPRILVASAAPAPQAMHRLNIGGLSDDEFVRVLGERYGALPKEILNDQDSRAFYLSVLRSDMRLLDAYEYRFSAPLECEVCVAYGADDIGLNARNLGRWQELSKGPFSLLRFEGAHFFHTQHAGELIRRMERTLRAEGPVTGGELSDV